MADIHADMTRLAQHLANSSDDFPTTVDEVIVFATAAVGATAGGLTLLRSGGLETIGATSQTVQDVDRAQYTAKQGPCVDAALDHRTQWSGDLAHDRRWPIWGAQAAAAGFHSVLSTDLHAGGTRIGALNLYADTKGAFDVDDADLADELAKHAAIALASSRKIDDLNIALSTRTLIGQAQGVLIERHQLSPQRAFDVLRRYSQDGNLKLRVVAEEVVASALHKDR